MPFAYCTTNLEKNNKIQFNGHGSHSKPLGLGLYEMISISHSALMGKGKRKTHSSVLATPSLGSDARYGAPGGRRRGDDASLPIENTRILLLSCGPRDKRADLPRIRFSSIASPREAGDAPVNGKRGAPTPKTAPDEISTP